MWDTTLWNQGAQAFMWAVAVAASLAGAISDVASRRIPNLLTGPLFLGGILWAVCVGGMAGLVDSAAGCVLLAGPYVTLFLLAGGGAGDAKLMGAIGAWLGTINALIALAAVSVSAIILSAVYVISKKQARSVLRNLGRLLWQIANFITLAERGNQKADPSSEQLEIPYGVITFVGVCTAAGGMLLWRG